jgi:hypothetical protein
VVVGDQGTVLTSPDGVNWHAETSSTTTLLNGITFGDGLFVAVGGSSVFVSADGREWVERDPGPNDGMVAIAYGNGRYMGVGGGLLSRLNFITSTNLADWVVGGAATVRPLRSIAFGNGQFRIVGNGGEGAYTWDGSSWLTGELGTFLDLYAVTFGNGMFLSVGQAGNVEGVGQAAGTTNDLYGILFANDLFVAVGDGGTIVSSPDGVHWLSTSSGIDTPLRAVAYGNGVYVAVGDAGRIVTSTDAVVWTVRSRGPIDNLVDITYGGRLVLGVGEAGAIVGSTNDLDWFSVASGTTATLTKVAFTRAMFIALSGAQGQLLTSLDGTAWDTFNFGPQTNLSAVAGSSDILVVLGARYDAQAGRAVAVALTSTNATSWVAGDLGTNAVPTALTYGNGMFVAVGDGPFSGHRSILSSSDGLSWTVREQGLDPTLQAVAYGNGQFLAAGGGGTVLLSQDGVSWQRVDPGPFHTAPSLAYGNGAFVICDYAGVFYSLDGRLWLPVTPPFPQYPPGAVTFAADTFFLAGPQGAVFESDPIVSLGLSSGGGRRLSLFGPAGRWQRIEGTDQVWTTNGWQNLDLVLVTNSPQLWIDQSPTGTHRCYRSVLVP